MGFPMHAPYAAVFEKDRKTAGAILRAKNFFDNKKPLCLKKSRAVFLRLAVGDEIAGF